MINLHLDVKHAESFFEEKELDKLHHKLKTGKENLLNKTGKGKDFLGWVDLPSKFDRNLIQSMKTEAARIAEEVEILVVVGIGGSYLGARAVIEALQHSFSTLQENRKSPLILYVGQNISEDYLADLIEILDKKEYAAVVISKSGTTTEPALAFRILKNHIEQKYGKDKARKRIVAITDAKHGSLKHLAVKEGYTTYVIPDDVGGRYSVLTPVGLFPIAVAGFDIEKLIEGAANMEKHCIETNSLQKNPAMMYAIVRNLFYQKGKKIEILVNYLPSLYYITEWWKQLYGESEGKEGKGIFPAGVSFSTDLHSMGQYIQEGERHLFETVISIERSHKKISIPYDSDDQDGLNYLHKKTITEVNHKAEMATTLAHVDGGVPNLKITLPELNETTLGELIYFFEFACGLSGYLLDVNPFDQPGVEEYKRNMFALLGKPGFEKETEKITKRIK